MSKVNSQYKLLNCVSLVSPPTRLSWLTANKVVSIIRIGVNGISDTACLELILKIIQPTVLLLNNKKKHCWWTILVNFTRISLIQFSHYATCVVEFKDFMNKFVVFILSQVKQLLFTRGEHFLWKKKHNLLSHPSIESK